MSGCAGRPGRSGRRFALRGRRFRRCRCNRIHAGRHRSFRDGSSGNYHFCLPRGDCDLRDNGGLRNGGRRRRLPGALGCLAPSSLPCRCGALGLPLARLQHTVDVGLLDARQVALDLHPSRGKLVRQLLGAQASFLSYLVDPSLRHAHLPSSCCLAYHCLELRPDLLDLHHNRPAERPLEGPPVQGPVQTHPPRTHIRPPAQPRAFIFYHYHRRVAAGSQPEPYELRLRTTPAARDATALRLHADHAPPPFRRPSPLPASPPYFSSAVASA